MKARGRPGGDPARAPAPQSLAPERVIIGGEKILVNSLPRISDSCMHPKKIKSVQPVGTKKRVRFQRSKKLNTN